MEQLETLVNWIAMLSTALIIFNIDYGVWKKLKTD